MSPRLRPPACRMLATIRRLTAACAVLGLTTMLFAAPGTAPPPRVAVLADTPQSVVVEFNIDGFDQAAVLLDGEAYTQLALPHEPVTHEAGAPELPYLARSLVVAPAADAVRVTIDERRSTFVEYTDIAVVPSKGLLLRTVDPATVPYSFGDAYEADDFYPGELATARTPYTLRDLRGVTVLVYPFQYNPVTRTLRVYTTLTVVVEPLATGNVTAPADAFERQLSRAFDELYRSHFINYAPDERYNPLDEQGDLLIICHDAWLANVQPLAAHKIGRGISTTVVGVSTIGNNSTAIKNYIQNLYNSSDLAFVLLVGDAAQVASGSASGGSSDSAYSKLAGGDNYPEIMVGRFSAENATQVDTQVQRTITYENLPAVAQDWYWRATGIASTQGAGQGDEGQADNVHMDEIRQWLLAAGYTLVDQIYDPSANTTMVANALNAGRGLVNYCGHGSTTSWSSSGFSNSNVNALVNDNMLPFIFSVACVNGQFDGYTCFAEAWLRATHNGVPTGAIGMYASSINQSWAPPMEAQDEFNLLVTDPTEPYHVIGALCYAGSCSMMDDYGSDGVSMFNTWILFGDPSLQFIGMPTGLKVTPEDGLSSEGMAGGPFTPSGITYTLENLDATPMTYQVVNTPDWLAVDAPQGTIPGHGSVQVTLSIAPAAAGLPNGRYAENVWFLNMTNHDGDVNRPVSLRVGIPQPVLTWNLDTDPGWTRNGQWAFGQPTGQGGRYGYPDPTAGATGVNVLGVNLDGNYPIALDGAHWVTLGPLDLTDVSETSIRYQRWLNSDHQPWVSAMVEVSSDGTTWTRVWENGDETITDNAWMPQSHAIWAVADNRPAVWIRWGYRVHRFDALPYSGWNLDDIELWGLDANAPVGCAGDANCDAVINWRDIDYFVAAISGEPAWRAMFGPDSPTCPYANNDVNDDGTVSWHDIDPLVNLMNTACN